MGSHLGKLPARPEGLEPPTLGLEVQTPIRSDLRRSPFGLVRAGFRVPSCPWFTARVRENGAEMGPTSLIDGAPTLATASNLDIPRDRQFLTGQDRRQFGANRGVTDQPLLQGPARVPSRRAGTRRGLANQAQHRSRGAVIALLVAHGPAGGPSPPLPRRADRRPPEASGCDRVDIRRVG